MDALELVLKTSLVVLLGAAITVVLRQASASLRHQVWVVTLVGVLALPLLANWLPWELRVLPAPAPAPAPIPTLASVTDPVLAPADAYRASVSPAPAPVESRVGPRSHHQVTGGVPLLRRLRERLTPRWSDILVGFWVVGALAVLGRFVLGLLWLRRLERSATPIRSADWTGAADRVAGTLGLRRRVLLLRSTQIHTPLTYGALRPVLLLPSIADTWSEDQRHAVLVHEFAHVRRADTVSLGIARLVCAIYWFNPLVWVATRRLRAEAERACDDWVLRTGARASAYASHLMQMVGTVGQGRFSHAHALPMASQSGFEGRLFAILAPHQDRTKLRRGHTIMNVVVIGSFIVTLAAMAPADGDRVPLAEPSSAVDSPAVVPAATPALAASEVRVIPVHDGTASKTKSEKTHMDAPVSVVLEPVAVATTHGSQMIEDPRSIAALSRALRTDDDPTVRKMAAWALGQLEDAEGVAALSDALRNDADEEVRETAAWALGQIETRSAVEALVAAIDDRDTRVRSTAVWALGQIEDRSAVSALARAVTDSDVSIRKTAVWALGQIEDRSAVPALATALRDEDADVRQQAAWALGQIESADGVDPLGSALQDSDARVRRQAAWALGQIESPRGVAALSGSVRGDDDVAVRSTAAWALGQIESRDAVPALSDGLSDTSAEVRKNAAWALGQIEPTTAPQALLDALRDEDADVRRMALWALSQIEDPAAVDDLRALMQDDDPQVRMSAIWALSRVRDDAAVRALAELLDDADPEVRRSAAAALGGKWRHANPRPWPRPQPRPHPRPRPNGGS